MPGEAVLIKKGERIPSNARQLSDLEVVDIQMQRIQKFEPQKEMRAFNYSSYAVSAAAGLSGFVIANTMRRNFRLGGLRKFLTYIPSVGLSGVIAAMCQEILLKRRVLVGKEGCPTCLAVKAGGIQLGLGVVYPYILSLLTCIPTARDYYTLPLPNKGGDNTYFKLLRQVTPKSSILLSMALLNIAVGSYIAGRQYQVFAEHFSQPPSKVKQLLSEEQEMLE